MLKELQAASLMQGCPVKFQHWSVGGEPKNHCMHFLNMVWTDLIYLVRDSPVTFDKGIRSFFYNTQM